MCNTWLVSISLVRQHVVQEVRVLCRVSLCCCSSYMLFTDFLLLWWVVHRPQPHGSMRTERGSSLPWHGSTMGLSTCSGMKHHTSNVFLVLSPVTSPLIHPLCCFLFVSYISSSVCLRRSTMYPCWNSGLQWVVSLSLRAVWDWLWLAQGNSWPPLALVTPRALWHQNPAVYTQYTSKCALANNLNGSLWTAVVVFSDYSKFSSLV